MPCLHEIPWRTRPVDQNRDSCKFSQDMNKALHITQLEFDGSMDEISSKVQPWDSGNFTFVRNLQDAPRCHGRVDLMRIQQEDGRAVAVKIIPSSWLKSGPTEFKRSHPQETEQPWRDMA